MLNMRETSKKMRYITTGHNCHKGSYRYYIYLRSCRYIFLLTISILWMLVLGILSSTTTLTSYNNIGSSLPNEGDCIHIVNYISAAYNQSSQTGCNTTEIKPLPQMNHPKHPFTLDSGPEKKGILLWTQFYGKGWGIEFGGNIFDSLHCPQRRCIVTHNRSAILQADAVLFNLRDMPAENDLPHLQQSSVYMLAGLKIEVDLSSQWP